MSGYNKPSEMLDTLRDLVQNAPVFDELDGPKEGYYAYRERYMEVKAAFERLDAWISAGGFLPVPWVRRG